MSKDGIYGKGEMTHLEELERLCRVIQDTVLCGLGQSAPNPVIASIRHFKNEYIDHIVHKKCTAHRCKNLLNYVIDDEKCIGCSLCSKKCSVDAISGKLKEKFAIDTNTCIKCGVCETVCKFDAVKCE